MILKKKNIDKELGLIKISQIKLVIGILLGISFSFAFYSFSYLLREAFRILTVYNTGDLLILTDQEVSFYNLILALISLVFGQSVTFLFLFDRPKKQFGKLNYRKTSIINDQRALNSFFLSWFSKIVLVIGVMYLIIIPGESYAFKVYPTYNYIFVLIVIVLFLQTWNTIGLVFKRKAQICMFISAILLTSIAFGFSRINLIDYKKINQTYLNNKINYNYRLELPETDCYESLARPSLIENIYLVENKIQQSKCLPVILVDNERIEIAELHKIIEKWQSERSEIEIPLLCLRLHIHRLLRMKFVNLVKKELSKAGISNIAYAVIPVQHGEERKTCSNFSFPIILPNWDTQDSNLKLRSEYLNKISNIIEVKQFGTGYLLNNSYFAANQIKEYIKKLIQQNPDYIVKYYVNDNLSFSDYFVVLSSTKEAVNELRNEYSLCKYSKCYGSLDYEEETHVRQKFPFLIFEITTEMNEMLENK